MKSVIRYSSISFFILFLLFLAFISYKNSAALSACREVSETYEKLAQRDDVLVAMILKCKKMQNKSPFCSLIPDLSKNSIEQREILREKARQCTGFVSQTPTEKPAKENKFQPKSSIISLISN